jgi:hypothetical protein
MSVREELCKMQAEVNAAREAFFAARDRIQVGIDKASEVVSNAIRKVSRELECYEGPIDFVAVTKAGSHSCFDYRFSACLLGYVGCKDANDSTMAFGSLSLRAQRQLVKAAMMVSERTGVDCYVYDSNTGKRYRTLREWDAIQSSSVSSLIRRFRTEEPTSTVLIRDQETDQRYPIDDVSVLEDGVVFLNFAPKGDQ